MATFGMSQDSAAIDRLRAALKKAKKTRLLKKLFQQDIRWTFKPLYAHCHVQPSDASLARAPLRPSDGAVELVYP